MESFKGVRHQDDNAGYKIKNKIMLNKIKTFFHKNSYI